MFRWAAYVICSGGMQWCMVVCSHTHTIAADPGTTPGRAAVDPGCDCVCMTVLYCTASYVWSRESWSILNFDDDDDD